MLKTVGNVLCVKVNKNLGGIKQTIFCQLSIKLIVNAKFLVYVIRCARIVQIFLLLLSVEQRSKTKLLTWIIYKKNIHFGLKSCCFFAHFKGVCYGLVFVVLASVLLIILLRIITRNFAKY